ncbi:MAG: hypothetical protein GTO46_08245 [Gemmatimonadetes bacterium]|nr:hypothetical protein [Gemmatimonadota bacterium]NIO31632.1 hypothetical protein [Gemmatimonadota bacterium]
MFFVGVIADGGIKSVSTNVPELLPVRVIEVVSNSYDCAGQSMYVAGVNDRTFAAPICPVSPVTVIVTIPPSVGGLGPTTVVSTLFACASMVSSDVMEKLWLASAVAGGRVP